MERVAPEAAGNGRAGLLLDLEVDQELGFPRVIRNRRQEIDLSALALRDEGKLLLEEHDAVSGETCRQLAVGQGEEIQEEGAEQILEQPVVAGHGGEVPPPWNRRKTPPSISTLRGRETKKVRGLPADAALSSRAPRVW